jgi:hypothetical protein
MRPLPDPSSAIFAFFFCGLLAVALARFEEIPSAQQPRADRYWLPILLLAIAAVLGGSMLVVAILAAVGGVGVSALDALTSLTGLLGQILLLLLTPFGYLVYWLIMLLEWLRGGTARPADPQVSAPAMPLDKQGTEPTQLPFLLEQFLRVLPVVLFLILASWLLIRALNRSRGDAEATNGEYRESIGGLGSLWNDLSGFFAGLWARLTGQARERLNALAAAVSQEPDAALSARQIYAKLLRLAARLGSPRRPEQTPLEYLPDLERALPEAGDDPAGVTAVYNQARYGASPPRPDDLALAREAWERIKSAAAAAGH